MEHPAIPHSHARSHCGDSLEDSGEQMLCLTPAFLPFFVNVCIFDQSKGGKRPFDDPGELVSCVSAAVLTLLK